MARYESLQDPNNDLYIDENNWVVGIMHKPDGRAWLFSR